MRRRAIVALAAGSLAAALAVASCNPIFGIVSRSAGPTWCEEDAQAGSAYCDDFDRVTAATMSLETPQSFHGSGEITDAAASSPPNSLLVSSDGASDADPGIIAGTLVYFGSTSPTEILPFHCRIDVQPAELVAAAKAGDVGLVAVGGQSYKGGGDMPSARFVTIESTPQGLTASLAVIGAEGGLGATEGNVCMLFGGAPPDKPWTTLRVYMAPLSALDASGVMPPCAVGIDGGKLHIPDGGLPEGGKDDVYVLLVQLDAFQAGVVIPNEVFRGQAYFAYGLAVHGGAAPVALHFDNVACWAEEGGILGP